MRTFALLGLALLLSDVAFLPSPAEARRTAIDQIPDPDNPGQFISVQTTLAGYCDLNGDECDPDADGARLSYEVSFGGGAFTNKVFVHGNGVLSFDQPIDFASFSNRIYNSESVGLGEYGPTVVSPGQSLQPDPFSSGGGFFQSGSLSLRNNGIVFAEWYTCLAPGVQCHTNAHSLTLTPTSGGYQGVFDFSMGTPSGSDQGYVIAGSSFSATGANASFFMPATFRGLNIAAQPVPEPGTWMMLILGFGAIGAALRRKRQIEMNGNGRTLAKLT